MITSRQPESWQDLQIAVAGILRECGFSVEIERLIDTARGKAVIDVWAQETVQDRQYTVLCECKNWKARVPQSVIHGFRTVVGDAGVNVGYIISAAGFQSGSLQAAELTNLRLMTWQEFQQEFERSWVENYLLPFVADRLELLLEYTEPLLPTAVTRLSETKRGDFIKLKQRYDVFGMLMMMFTPYMQLLDRNALPVLPLRSRLTGEHDPEGRIPADVLDSVGYKEFLAAALVYADQAVAEFNNILKN